MIKVRSSVSSSGWRRFLSIIIIFPLFIFILVSGCEEDNIIPEEEFIRVYVDLMIVQDTTRMNSLPLDSLKEIIFTKHNITSELYDKTVAKYNSSPENWEEFFDKAIAYLEKLKTKKD